MVEETGVLCKLECETVGETRLQDKIPEFNLFYLGVIRGAVARVYRQDQPWIVVFSMFRVVARARGVPGSFHILEV